MSLPIAPSLQERRQETLLTENLLNRGSVAAQHGFTLVELMVGMTLGLLILVVMVTLFANTSVARGEIDKSSRQIENGRYALQVLSEEIRHAGYYGPMLNPPPLPGGIPDPCLITTAAVQGGLGLAIQGSAPASSAAAFPTCLKTPAAGYRDGTAVVVVRRAFASSVTAFSDVDFNIQVSGCPGDPNPFVVGTALGDFPLHSNGAPGCKPLATAPAAAIAPLYVRLFFVSNCSGLDCTGGGDSVPTLKRMDVKPGGLEITSIVDGIENLQIDYGRDTDGNGTPDVYDPTSTPPTSVANWDNVMAARIYVLARNIDASGGHSDTKTYSLGDVSYTPAGNDLRFKRHAYSELVRLNNPAGRRE
jgi:type IV pilus assembly protein PilW